MSHRDTRAAIKQALNRSLPDTEVWSLPDTEEWSLPDTEVWSLPDTEVWSQLKIFLKIYSRKSKLKGYKVPALLEETVLIYLETARY